MLTRAEETVRLHLDTTVRRMRQGYNQWQSLLKSFLHLSTFRCGAAMDTSFLNVVHKGIVGISCL